MYTVGMCAICRKWGVPYLFSTHYHGDRNGEFLLHRLESCRQTRSLLRTLDKVMLAVSACPKVITLISSILHLVH